MRFRFYPKLALEGIRKNKRLYVPYLLTCIGMVMMYYITAFLNDCPAVEYLPGAGFVRMMLGFGGWVIAIFAAVFLFYTNSFLIRRRKKEFGLYNILGMGKGNIAHILIWEYLITIAAALGGGLFAGIAFSKLAELGLVNVLNADVKYTLYVSGNAIVRSVLIFGMIFFLLYLNTVAQIKFSNAIQLLHSEHVGEKPPKANWLMGIAGVFILAGAYYIAVAIEDPLSALFYFFIAVVMVMIGTYLLFIFGSVWMCRILQKNKKYYYNAKHFVSVSSMSYRMKRNGAGLASICILATMVLVMLASTSCLYFGTEDALLNRYPRELCVDVRMRHLDTFEKEVRVIRKEIEAKNEAYQAKVENLMDYRAATVSGMLLGDTLETDVTKVNEMSIDTMSKVYTVHFIPLEDYNRLAKTSEELAEDEVLIYVEEGDFKEDTLKIRGAKEFRVKQHLRDLEINGDNAMEMLQSLYVIVPDFEESLRELIAMKDMTGTQMVVFRWTYFYDTGLDSTQQMRLRESIHEDCMINGLANRTDGYFGYSCDSREENRDDFFVTFGSLLFLGGILSVVFIFAAVLIIYYKQISEGYEDEARFAIMQKVGMTKPEIRRSINSQLLLVFFMPLLAAGCHLAFAFPIVQKMLLCFNLNNVELFAVTTMICFVLFSVLYMIVYRVTSNAYYKIVSGMEKNSTQNL